LGGDAEGRERAFHQQLTRRRRITDQRPAKPPYRIAIGGIAIESSTFSPLASTLADFRILRGEEMHARYPFMPDWRFQERADVTWLPCLYAGAIPGGPVTGDAYAAMKAELLERIRAVLPLDGFYLDLHGAMAVQGLDDAEGDLAAAIRALVGPGCLVSASMDLHGNVTARLVELVNLFTAYRLAPHDDALETRERACTNLLRCLDQGIRPLRAWTRIPVILPGERTSTLVEPGRSLYAGLAESDAVPGVLDASLWVGYVWADQARSGATVVVTGTDGEQIRREANNIARRYWETRHAFDFVVPAGSADWCIARAVALDDHSILISDSGDNPTAGGVGDVPYMTERLLAHPAFASAERTAIVASIADAAAVAACQTAGMGQEVAVTLGGKLDPVHGQPLPVRGTVTTLSPADRVGGDIAVLRVGGVHIIVTSRRKPYHYVRDMQALGLDPAEHHVTAVKIGYLVPDLRRAARHALLALTPGAVNQDIPTLTYTRVPRPVYPLDPAMTDPELAIRLFDN
jgi:microcystin degradation protein MlrC